MEYDGKVVEMGNQDFDHVLVRLIHFYEDNPDKARKLPPTTNFLKVLKDEMFLGEILDDAEDEKKEGNMVRKYDIPGTNPDNKGRGCK